MGSLYKRHGFWYIDYYDNRRRVRRKIGTSKRVAQIALVDAMLAVEKKAAGVPVYDKTIDELFERYITYSKTNHSPSTVQRYKEVLTHFRKFLNAQHGKVKMLTDITPSIIEAYKAYRKQAATTRGNGEGKSTSPKTINLELGACRRIALLDMYGIIPQRDVKEEPGGHKIQTVRARPDASTAAVAG